MKDHYRTLGVPENASEQDIKLAYRRLAKRYHPDMNAGAKGAEEKFKEIVEAYDVLSDFTARKNYDAKRMGRIYFSTGSFYNNPTAQEEKKGPKRKEYSEEELNRARFRHKKKLTAHMERRKKILTGMIVAFILYVFASGGFEYYIEKSREKESQEIAARMELMRKNSVSDEKKTIENMDSPYDQVFGEGIYIDTSINRLVIYMPFSDAVICAVQNDPPFKTIRNEFIHAPNAFVMPEMPEGSYTIKLYTGKNWDVDKKTPDGKKLGGFTKDERFYKVHDGPYRLNTTSKRKSDTNSCDTIILNPFNNRLDSMSRMEFFSTGGK